MKPIPLRVFFLGLIFTICYALIPAAILTWRWVVLWQDWPDWRVLGPVVYSTGGLGVVAYIARYRAYLELPPTWSQAWELAEGARKRETTVQTVNKPDAAPTITTTVKETQIIPPADPV